MPNVLQAKSYSAALPAVIIAVFAALLLSACNPMEQLESAESKVAQFHTIYNSADSRSLYGLTAQEFRDATTPEQMDDLVALVTERMGKLESAERQGFNINSNNGTTYTVVTMASVFEKGEAVETFTFSDADGDIALVGWNVDSPNFMDAPADGDDTPDTPEPAEAPAQTQ